MKSKPKILSFIDAIPDDQLPEFVSKVIAWETFPSRAETIVRRELAVNYLVRLRSQDAPAWCAAARAFLHACGRDYPDLASEWVVEDVE